MKNYHILHPTKKATLLAALSQVNPTIKMMMRKWKKRPKIQTSNLLLAAPHSLVRITLAAWTLSNPIRRRAKDLSTSPILLLSALLVLISQNPHPKLRELSRCLLSMRRLFGICQCSYVELLKSTSQYWISKLDRHRKWNNKGSHSIHRAKFLLEVEIL